LRSNLQSAICDLKFVSLAGDVLTRDDIVHGGATGEAVNSVLQRKNQIAAIEAEERQIQAQLENVTQRRDEFQLALEAARTGLDEAREEKQNATLHVATLRNQPAMNEREAKE